MANGVVFTLSSRCRGNARKINCSSTFDNCWNFYQLKKETGLSPSVCFTVQTSYFFNPFIFWNTSIMRGMKRSPKPMFSAMTKS